MTAIQTEAVAPWPNMPGPTPSWDGMTVGRAVTRGYDPRLIAGVTVGDQAGYESADQAMKAFSELSQGERPAIAAMEHGGRLWGVTLNSSSFNDIAGGRQPRPFSAGMYRERRLELYPPVAAVIDGAAHYRP